MWLRILGDVALCFLIAGVVWTPLGRSLLARIGNENISKSCSIAVALGMGSWGMLVLAVGLAGGLYLAVLTGLAVALFVALRLHRYLRPIFPPVSWPVGAGDRLTVLAFYVLAGVFLVLSVSSALAPELAFDALNVHLPYARDSALLHRIQFAPNNWNSSMPALPLMAYITAFVFSGQTLAKLLNLICFLACGGVVYFFARRWWGVVHGTAAALLFWSCPIALYEAGTTLVDLPLSLYSAIAVLSLLEWTRSGQSALLRLSAISLGFALGCKYHAAFWVLPLLAILLLELTRRRARARAISGEVLSNALIVALLVLPWLVRAWMYTGNPVFPGANGLFRSPYFTPQMEAAAFAIYELEGVGRSWSALALLPWTVTFNPGPFRGTLGVVFLAGCALALLRLRQLEVRYMFLAAGAYFYSWALTAQDIRYLLPLAPLLAVLSVAGFLGCPAEEGRNSPDLRKSSADAWRRVLSAAALLVLIFASAMNLPSLYPLWVKDWTYWHSYLSPFGYLLGRESAQQFLQRDVPSIYVYDFINQKLSSHDRVLLLNDASQFYSRVPTLYSFTVEAEDILLQEDEAAVVQELKQSRITHVLLNYNGIAPLPGVEPRKGLYFFLDGSFQKRFLEEVYSRNKVVLFKVRTS